MDGFVEMNLDEDALARLGLPNIPYPIPLEAFEDAVSGGGDMPFAVMLFGLQASSSSSKEWKELEPAMARLVELVAPDDDHAVVTAAGDNWWLEIGPVDLNGE